jgi:hypothetical protein
MVFLLDFSKEEAEEINLSGRAKAPLTIIKTRNVGCGLNIASQPDAMARIPRMRMALHRRMGRSAWVEVLFSYPTGI